MDTEAHHDTGRTPWQRQHKIDNSLCVHVDDELLSGDDRLVRDIVQKLKQKFLVKKVDYLSKVGDKILILGRTVERTKLAQEDHDGWPRNWHKKIVMDVRENWHKKIVMDGRENWHKKIVMDGRENSHKKIVMDGRENWHKKIVMDGRENWHKKIVMDGRENWHKNIVMDGRENWHKKIVMDGQEQFQNSTPGSPGRQSKHWAHKHADGLFGKLKRERAELGDGLFGRLRRS